MKVALDTNAYTDLARGVPSVLNLVSLAQEVVLPFMVLAELRAGFAVGSKGRANIIILQAFLSKPTVAILYADEQTVDKYAAIYRTLRTTGKMIPVADLWIAAIVLQHDLALCSRDSHFDFLPQIRRV